MNLEINQSLKLTFSSQISFFSQCQKSLAEVQKISTCDARIVENSQPSNIITIISRSIRSIEQMRLSDDNNDNNSTRSKPNMAACRMITDYFCSTVAQRSIVQEDQKTTFSTEHIWSPINYSMNLIFMLLASYRLPACRQCK